MTPVLGINFLVVSLLVGLFFLVSLLMIFVVLIQRPQGGGLSAAFGAGQGSGQTAFGAKTGDALTLFTIACFVVYLLLAIGLNYAARPENIDAQGGARVTAPGDAGAIPPEQSQPVEGEAPDEDVPAVGVPDAGTPDAGMSDVDVPGEGATDAGAESGASDSSGSPSAGDDAEPTP